MSVPRAVEVGVFFEKQFRQWVLQYLFEDCFIFRKNAFPIRIDIPNQGVDTVRHVVA